jgi:hypothetical protein
MQCAHTPPCLHTRTRQPWHRVVPARIGQVPSQAGGMPAQKGSLVKTPLPYVPASRTHEAHCVVGRVPRFAHPLIAFGWIVKNTCV